MSYNNYTVYEVYFQILLSSIISEYYNICRNNKNNVILIPKNKNVKENIYWLFSYKHE